MSNIVAEPQKSWGGLWTFQKLQAFEKYVNAYLTIMNKYRDKYNWKLIYFDGFAGSGSINKEENTELFLELFQDDELNDLHVYKGAAERILQIEQKGFDFYYFIDKDAESNSKLQNKLSRFSNKYSQKQLNFRISDANNEIKKLANALKTDTKYKSLVLLDPFGMQMEWEAIEELKGTGTDLWILIPTGVIVNRLLDRKGELKSIDKLTSFFGMTEEEIRKAFYESSKSNTLFGEIDIVHKIEEPIRKIADLYIEKLKKCFEHVTSDPLILYNTKNVPIYHFAFASNNETAYKIAGKIIKTTKK